MIAYITGIVTLKTPTYLIIDVGGIGYQLHISLETYEKTSELGKARLWVHEIIHEDSHQLYGFYGEQERELFRQLISVTGIGPNTARTMLSMGVADLRHAIIQGNISLLKAMKGIGPKTAQRLVVELQDSLRKSMDENGLAISEKSLVVEEAAAALVMLGFSRPTAEKAIAKVMAASDGNLNLERIIKEALKSI